MKRTILTGLVVIGMASACMASEKRIAATYKTQLGDTLDSIAKRFRMAPRDLSRLNPSTQFDRLQVGESLRVLPRTGGSPLLYPTIPPQVVPEGDALRKRMERKLKNNLIEQERIQRNR